jgi:hypothetical protein
MCLACNQRPRAVAYHKDQRVQYRSCVSTVSSEDARNKPPEPRWRSAGYKKKIVCDRCGFRSRYASQLVYHVDGNQHNTSLRNLKTVCLNCVEEIKRLDRPWLPGDLEPDH